MNTAKITHRALRIIPAFIMGQTLFFKFTSHPESVALFTKLSMEPNGRIGIGILELIACLLLIF
jgi:putative oxidoreductase